MCRVLFPAILLILMVSCRDPRDVDVSSVSIPPMEVLRMEDDIFSLDASTIHQHTPVLQEKYGAWFDHYIMSFLNRKGVRDSAYATSVLDFTHDRDVKGAYHQSKVIYDDDLIDDIFDEIEYMARRFHHYFPTRPLPRRLITCTTGWSYSFAYMDSALIVSLDMYLGDTSVYYKMLRIPQYELRRKNPAHITSDVARGWLLTEFDTLPVTNKLLHHAVFYGKLYYAVEKLLPDLHDSLIIGYSTRQLNYCDEFERKLWGYVATDNRLFEDNLNTVRELTSEGPFTGAISKECPPRIAMWIGWQLVRSYMSNNKEVTLEQLMNDRNAEGILAKSKYRP